VPTPETVANEAATTLNGAITSSATSATVTSSTGFPSPPFRARVSGNLTAGGTGTEYVLVTDVVGATWTISRGTEAPYSTGLGFATAATVEQVVTVSGIFRAGPYVDVRDFGAKANYRSTATGAMTSGSATLTDSTGGKFQASDAGKIIFVNGAGAGAGVLQTTIATYVSITQVTLTATAGTTVSGATYGFGSDNGTPIQNAINYAATLGTSNAGTGSSTTGLTGATVFIPAGVYLHSTTIAIPSRVRVLGAGREATTLRRTQDVVSISVYGTGTADANRNWYSALEHLTVDGNDRWITGVDLVYASQFLMRGVFVYNVHHIGVDLVEVWDSSFTDVFLQFCGGIGQAEQPSIYVRSTRAASGFGSSTDTSNELKFTNVHTEHFRAGAIKIAPGFGAALNGPNGIYFSNIKTETAYISNSQPFILIAAQTERIHIKNVYSYAAAFLDTNVAVPIIQNDSVGQTSIRDVYASNGGTATISSAVNLNISGSGMCVLDGAYGSYTTAPTVAHVNVAQAGDLEISNVRTNLGTRIAGYEIDAAERMLSITADATTTSTTAGNLASMTFSNVTPGTYRVALKGMFRSSLTTAGPRFGVGGTATATGTGVVTMYTSTTSGTVTEMTAISTTFGTNPATATTSFLVDLSFLAVVTVAGTLGIRWNVSAAATGTLRGGSVAVLTRVR
jgi:hypothetical protein